MDNSNTFQQNLKPLRPGDEIPLSGKTAKKPTPKPKEVPSAPTNDKPKKPRSSKPIAIWLALPLIVTVLILGIIGLIYPSTFTAILNFLGVLVLIIFVAFILLGIFVLLGLRKQVKDIFSLIFEGSVRYIDFAHALSTLWDAFIKLLKEVIIAVSPVFAIAIAIAIYYGIMYLFHTVALQYDIALLTIGITILMACTNAILGIYRTKTIDEKSFAGRFSKAFTRTFIDAVEVVTMVLFLTIDLKNPFFLPAKLRSEMHAELFGFDLMKRGITADGLRTTLLIAGGAILIEIIRKIYRIVMTGIFQYRALRNAIHEGKSELDPRTNSFIILREATRVAFKDNLDDLTKFVGFTTILTIAFFFFPRLKLVSLLFFNLTSLTWDLLYPKRIMVKAKYDDLVSRVIAKVFRL